MSRTIAAVLTVGVGLSVLGAGSPATAEPQAPPVVEGFRALAGPEARDFVLPNGLRVLWTASEPATGFTQTRYQQVVDGADVHQGQLTVLDRDGVQVAVIGNHFPDVPVRGAVRVTREQARERAARELGPDYRFDTSLRLDASTGRRFYEVDAKGFDKRFVLWLDAENGARVNKYDALQTHNAAGDPATGVKGDAKVVSTSHSGTSHVLRAADGRQATYDARQAQSSRKLPGTLFADSDGTWNTPGRVSPGQPAAVDAHYYADVTDDFYRTTFGRDSLDDKGKVMVSTVHYGRNYNNAFWNGQQMVYGDGDGTTTFRELSGGLDVVSHELTHGVTEFTSDLVYQGESGALNESFSDIMGNNAEFYAATAGKDGARPDWFIGEDVYLGEAGGFRNMQDPAEDGDPDHYSERYTGAEDNGGVHSNSGIPNHAYYLLVNGGRNAGEGKPGHAHTGPAVTAIGVAAAQRIFYQAFTGLPSTATMRQARAATVTVATALHGAASTQATSTAAAWQAVGVS